MKRITRIRVGAHGIAAALLAFGTFAVVAPGTAIELDQEDDFQNGTTEGWQHGKPNANAPTNIPDGGPDGAGDRFMRFGSTGGGGAGSRFVAFNEAQWTGDYVAAGVTEIAVSVENTGASDLHLRVTFQSPSGDKFSSVTAVVVPVSSGWQEGVFSLASEDLACAIQSCSGSPEDTLANVIELRILSNSGGPAYKGERIPAQAGFDNIQALPEPGTQALAMGVLVSLALLSHRRRHAARASGTAAPPSFAGR